MATGIIGLGQIGGSIALALVGAGQHVLGWDSDEETRELARSAGVDVAIGVPEVVRDSDTVFVCVPLHLNRVTLETLLQLRRELSVTPTITDVASYKNGTYPNSPDGSLILGHPMAGGHGHGFTTAKPDLFQGPVWILILTENSDPVRTAKLAAALTLMGARIRFCDVPWHDQAVSLVSALPHALAVALGAVVGRQTDSASKKQFAAGSFGSATRVLKSSNELVSDLLRFNRPTLLPLLEQYSRALTSLSNTLQNGVYGELSEFVSGAQHGAAIDDSANTMKTVMDIAVSDLGEFLRSMLNRRVEVVGVQSSGGSFRFEIFDHRAGHVSLDSML